MINGIKEFTDYFFNWKKNPASVFFLAIPLFLIGMGNIVAVAVLQWKINDDPVYAYIVLGGMALLAFGLYPILKMLPNRIQNAESN